ncbi:hypothetical protein [Silvibacterium dinghuense]|uniref:Uncharacterized protein n=1 Tax=Silvibacterium dinghuense TaxID=1560006 RepID=A0A4Q1SDK8_9BACT|nr:hypothetical protein [Silvibacterium dinghuense]RXS95155.1 hypothetical protein ESZ00_11135 [Silvibacterium dinghuense]GGH11125.1 hypothetical protein GCM10011586_29700 [Silvibacterium dinghuense]
MSGPIVSAHADQSPVLRVVSRKVNFFPEDDVYAEHPTGAYRGLMFAMLFNLALAVCGFLIWFLWHTLR